MPGARVRDLVSYPMHSICRKGKHLHVCMYLYINYNWYNIAGNMCRHYLGELFMSAKTIVSHVLLCNSQKAPEREINCRVKTRHNMAAGHNNERIIPLGRLIV